ISGRRQVARLQRHHAPTLIAEWEDYRGPATPAAHRPDAGAFGHVERDTTASQIVSRASARQGRALSVEARRPRVWANLSRRCAPHAPMHALLSRSMPILARAEVL